MRKDFRPLTIRLDRGRGEASVHFPGPVRDATALLSHFRLGPITGRRLRRDELRLEIVAARGGCVTVAADFGLSGIEGRVDAEVECIVIADVVPLRVCA